MQRGKRKLIAALAAGLVLAGAAAFALWPRPVRATPENFRQISLGMSRAQVQTVLGPPGEYLTGPVDFVRKGTRDVWAEDHWTDERLKKSDSWKGHHDMWTNDSAYTSIFMARTIQPSG
jgi:hypothetical protein